MAKKVLVPIADGIEEIEAVTMIDVLRRAGADVTVASVQNLQVTASYGVRIFADKLIEHCAHETFDLIVLPGGMPGAEHLRDSSVLVDMIKKQEIEGRLYGAICASPAVVLEHHGLLEGRQATCHPAFEEMLKDKLSTVSRIAAYGGCITSRGPGTAMEFSLKLVELLFDEQKAQEVREPMVVD